VDLPATFGKYQLMQLVGKGATGTVYRALDTFSGQLVAFKLVDRAVLEDPEFDEECRRQFLNEVSLAGRLHHPHIVDIIEAAVTDDNGYVVMEYVPGGTLSQYSKPNSLLPPEDALQILFKCCGALDYAFRQGIVHRDIKPANIMAPSLREVKVTDFGAAVFQRAQSTQVASVGTPYYMSPEQMRGEQLTHLSDMYSLGILGYELLTGERPFTGQSLAELFLSINETPARRPSSLRPDLPQYIDPLILTMIAKKPEQRFPTWADLALEIGRLGQFAALRQDISDSEKFRSLCQLKAFADFSDPEVWEMLRACAWSRLPAGTTVIKEGDKVESMYLLARGNAKVMRQGRLLNTLGSGDWFGEMACLQERRIRHTTVEVVSDALIAELPFGSFAKLSERLELKLSRMMLRMLADRLSLSDARVLTAR
jgi:eukaryotic-like serine/threonine-protein kinase